MLDTSARWRRPRLRIHAALATGAVAVAALLVTPAPAVGAGSARPFVRGGETVPTYSYSNAVRESVQVTTPLDNDGDRQPDRVTVDVIRPKEAADNGVKVPVIMVASPYYQSAGRGNESETKKYDANGTITKFPLYYDNYFVPRGYAVAQVDLAGTNRSTGCDDVGGREEILSVKAAIDWLNGRAPARYLDGAPAVARWTTGKVGMIGKSWDGTLANGVAATGVDGLTTIVPISAISSWYDYLRFNGVVRSPDDVVFLHQFVSGRPAGVCDATIARMRAGADDATGDYNDFWAERDYRRSVRSVKASVFIVHGLNDLNVKTSHVAPWWDALAERKVPRKLWLAQAGHVDPFDFRRREWVDTLHRWFDFWLQGLRNGIMNERAVSIERGPGQWVDESTWPARTREVTLPLGPGDGTTGKLGGKPKAGVVRTFTDNPDLSEADAVADPNTPKSGRLVFLSDRLPGDVRLSGTGAVTLRVRVDRPTTELTARLVDYGRATRVDYSRGGGIRTLPTQSCWGESAGIDDSCYFDTAENVVTGDLNVVTRGWKDAAHHRSLRRTTPLEPGRWYTITVPLLPHDSVVAAGHVAGLVISATDFEQSTPATTGATIDVDLGGSSLTVPVSGTRSVSAGGDLPPHVDAQMTPRTATRGDVRDHRADFR
jgi:X-Pro dipeptidyl-peptidase